jgi:chromosome segregation ATPase
MSKVTDGWNEFSKAQDVWLNVVETHRVARTEYASLEGAWCGARVHIQDAETMLAKAKQLMAVAAKLLQDHLAVAATGGEHNANTAWLQYEEARTAVKECRSRVAGAVSDRDVALAALEAHNRRLAELEAEVTRAEKRARAAADALRLLIPSEVAGYCGKLEVDEQVLLASEPVEVEGDALGATSAVGGDRHIVGGGEVRPPGWGHE